MEVKRKAIKILRNLHLKDQKLRKQMDHAWRKQNWNLLQVSTSQTPLQEEEHTYCSNLSTVHIVQLPHNLLFKASHYPPLLPPPPPLSPPPPLPRPLPPPPSPPASAHTAVLSAHLSPPSIHQLHLSRAPSPLVSLTTHLLQLLPINPLPSPIPTLQLLRIQLPLRQEPHDMHRIVDVLV